MARARTLAEMRDEVYQRADVRSSYIPPAEVHAMLNGSLAELYDLCLSVNPDWYIQDSSWPVGAGQVEYALPADFWKVAGVDWTTDSPALDTSTWYPMHRFNFAERNQQQQNGSSGGYSRYRIVGGNLRLRPRPTWSGTIKLWYIPAPVILVNDGDAWDGVAGWEEYAIVDTLIKVRSKREEDATLEDAQKKALYARIKNSACDRDVGEPDRIRDVCSELDGTELGGLE